jgi:hypothetical protein
MTEADDRKDVVFFSVTEKHKELLRALEEELFQTEAGAFKACVALALEKQLTPTPFTKGLTTWNPTTMSDLVDFVQWYTGTNTPVRMANELGFAGLEYFRVQIESGKDPKDIFFSSN